MEDWEADLKYELASKGSLKEGSRKAPASGVPPTPSVATKSVAQGIWAGGAAAAVRTAPAGPVHAKPKKKGKKGKAFNFTPAGDGFQT